MFLRTEVPYAKWTVTVHFDYKVPLYCQPMGLTVPELLAQRQDSIQIMTDHKGDR